MAVQKPRKTHPRHRERPRLLFLLSAFPPVGGTPSLRMTQWIKYLSRLGWRCHVVTPTHARHKFHADQQLMESIRARCTVHRLPETGSRIELAWQLYLEVERLAAGRDFEWLVTTTPNDWYMALGCFYARRFGLRWHCDLREPPVGQRTPAGWIKQSLLARADLITTAWRPEVMVPKRIASNDRCHWLPQHFDPEDFSPVGGGSEPPERGPRRFVHTGSLFDPKRSPIPLLRVIGSLRKRGVIDAGRVRFEFVGPIKTPGLEKRIRRCVTRNRLGDLVRFRGFREHAETVRLMQRAHICFGFHARPLDALKMFEYLGARKPILAYYHGNSSMKRIFRNQRGIHWVDYGDEAKLGETIARLVHRPGLTVPSSQLRRRFNVRCLMDRLDRYYEDPPS